MKDSGIEWIGEIPEEWELRKYKHFAISGMGNTILREDTVDSGVPVYSATQSDAIFGYIEKPNLVLNKGDFVIPARGNSIGYIYVVTEERATCTQTTIYSRIKNINNKFLFYCGCGFKNYWFEFDNTAIPQLTVSQVQNNIVPVPNLSQQQKIATFLDQKCSEIDHILEKTRESIEEYKKLKQSIITEAVTKGLNRNVEMKESGVEWIGEVPEHWEVKYLNQIFVQLKNKNINMAEDNRLSLSYGNIVKRDIDSNDGLLPESFENYNIVNNGDIVLRLTDMQNDHTSLRVGLAREKGIITSAYITIRSKDNIDTEYFYFYLHSFDIYKGFYGMGSGVRQSLTFDGIKYLKMIVPPPKEQNDIVKYLNKRKFEIDSLVSQKETLLTDLEAYKKSLIFECVTGKREVAHEPR